MIIALQRFWVRIQCSQIHPVAFLARDPRSPAQAITNVSPAQLYGPVAEFINTSTMKDLSQ